MSQDIRVIYQAKDITPAVTDYRSGAEAFAYIAGQYLYVGSVMPFNNLWFEPGVFNTNTSLVSVSNWFGNLWYPAVDIRDDSDGMKKAGRISWSTDRLKGWDIEQTSEDVTGLEAFKVYWRYWARLSWSANFSSTTTLKYIGQKFSNDSILATYYPDLLDTEILTGFAAGKTNWDEQHYAASDALISDLRASGIVVSGSQVLDWTIFQVAACHKVAEIVYKAFGQPYFDQLKQAREDYISSKKVTFNSIDRNGNGNLDPVERTISTNFATR